MDWFRASFAALAVLAGVALPAACAAQTVGHEELIVAVDRTNRLVLRYEDKTYPVPASQFTGIDGYAYAFPGVSSLYKPEADGSFAPPDAQSSLVFVFEEADTGAHVLADRGTGPMRAGESFALGAPYFDVHPVWILDSGAKAATSYAIRLRVRDESGRHAESDVFTVRFAPDDRTQAYVCPMRCGGNRISNTAGRCDVCGMALKLLSGRDHRVDLSVDGKDATKGVLEAGRTAKLRFRIQSPDGEPARNLEIVHEKPMHLLMVSSDLAWFAHEHPEMQDDGTFLLDFTFPHGGAYTLYHDFTPAGVGMQVVPVTVEVAGTAAAPVPLVASEVRRQTVDGLTFELDTPAPIMSLKTQALTFRVSRDNGSVTDLEPYLGAMGHLILVSEDRSRFVHSHPIERTKGQGDEASRRGGPDVVFSALFPAPGRYKLWGQFQHAGRVLTVPFVIDVTAPR